MKNVVQLIFGMLGVAIGVFAFKKILKKHRLIDTESVAIVEDIKDLGRDGGKLVYAIKYKIQSSEPFEIFETPCKKQRKIGTVRSIFYENENPKSNYYFKTIGQFDKRFIMPILILVASVITIVASIAAMV